MLKNARNNMKYSRLSNDTNATATLVTEAITKTNTADAKTNTADDGAAAQNNSIMMFDEHDEYSIINMNGSSSNRSSNNSNSSRDSSTDRNANNNTIKLSNNYTKNNKHINNRDVDHLLMVADRVKRDDDDEIRLSSSSKNYYHQRTALSEYENNKKRKHNRSASSENNDDNDNDNDNDNSNSRSNITSANSESHQFLLDHEQTMEVPLLDNNSYNNNEDYDDVQWQQRQRHHQQQQQPHICRCQQPGFGVNLMDKSAQEAKFKIILAISLCIVFMIIEFLGGYFAGSLAIVTDAAHLASDCISFVIGLVSIWLGGRPPDRKMSFGYKRMEVMGAIISIWSIWILTATLVAAALQRLYSNDYDLDAKTMLIISGVGIIINIIMAHILHGSSILPGMADHGHTHSQPNHKDIHKKAMKVDGTIAVSLKQQHTEGPHERNLNLRAATIHVIGDLVQSIGIFLAAIFIHFIPSAKFMDPVCTILFSIIVLLTTVGLFKESICILVDAVPKEVSIAELSMDLTEIDGVRSVHHLNVWKHTTNYNVMMVHLVVDLASDSDIILEKATAMAGSHNYNIKHSTIQIERTS